MPPHENDAEDYLTDQNKELTMFFTKQELAKMKKKFGAHNTVVIFIDGACIGNPGPSASAACFFGYKLEPE